MEGFFVCDIYQKTTDLVCVPQNYSSKLLVEVLMKRNRHIINSLLICALMQINGMQAQSVSLEPEPGFTEYATYYVSSFDLQTGASNFQLFRFRLQSTSYPVYTKIDFLATMVSPTLGINTQTTIVDLETAPLQLNADVILDNQDLSTNTSQLLDVNGNTLPLSVSINQVMDVGQFEQILSSVITTGRLAAGHYTFSVHVYSGSSEDDLSMTDTEDITIVVESPTYISLESPGGALADTSMNEIYNTFPFFMWYPQFCTSCDMSIRVAEYNPSIHSSMEDAIEDETMLPFDQAEDWEFIGNVTSFQYPVSNARLLEHNKIYVWQVKASLPTTVGVEEIESSIFAFKIGNLGGTSPIPPDINPIVQMLGQAISADEFNGLFGPGGSLEGYVPNGTFSIDGNTVDQSTIMTIISQVISQNATVINISVSE